MLVDLRIWGDTKSLLGNVTNSALLTDFIPLKPKHWSRSLWCDVSIFLKNLRTPNTAVSLGVRGG